MRNHMARVLGVGLLCMAWLAALGNGVAEAQTSLSWKFKKGEKLNYVMDQKMAMKMNVNGMVVDTNVGQLVDMLWEIQEVDSQGVATMKQKINRVRLKMDGPFGTFEYDSKEGKLPEDPIGQALGPIMEVMAGAEFTMKMNAQGDVSDVKLPDKLVEALNPAAAGIGGAMFSEDGLKNMTAQSAVGFPKEAVSKGKSWNKATEIKQLFGTMKIDNTFTYQGPESRNGAQLEKIELKTEQSIEPAADGMFEIKIKSQDAKGAVYFDNKAGRMIDSEVKVKMLMEVNVMGMVIEQEMEQTVSTKLTK